MKRLVTLLVANLFFIWILPLGVFIKPAQEKVACGGRRAICLCSHMKAKAESNATEETSLQGNPDTSKEPGTSGSGGGSYYLCAHTVVQEHLSVFNSNNTVSFTYRNPFIRSIEHVPKAY